LDPSGDSQEPDDSQEPEERSTSDITARYAADRARRKQRVDEFFKSRDAGRALYCRDAGNVVLRDSIAAFVDELGFAQRVSALTDEDLREDVLCYDDARLQLSNPGHDWDEYMRILYFSDNVGIGLPIRDDDIDGGLAMVLGVVAAYQLQLALDGRFVRGGITRGPLYADNSFITGKALVDAVVLEKDHAVWPRVLVDQACCELAMKQIDDFDEVGAVPLMRTCDVQRLLLRDGDRVIVNYLGELLSTDPDWYIDAALKVHADHIKHKLDEHRQNEKVLVKYQWAAEYHDFFVTQVTWFPEYVIGSQQTRDFASFSLGWLRADQAIGPVRPVPEEVIERFERQCARADVGQIVALRDSGAPATESEKEEEQDPVDVVAEIEPVVGSIQHSCDALITPCEQLSVPPGYAVDVRVLVEGCRTALAELPKVLWTYRGIAKEEVHQCLLTLDKALSMLRTDYRAWGFAVLSMVILTAKVGADLDAEVHRLVPPLQDEPQGEA
jgi:hypothetical protein